MRPLPWTSETLEDAIDGHARAAARAILSSIRAPWNAAGLLADARRHARAFGLLRDEADRRASARWRELVTWRAA